MIAAEVGGTVEAAPTEAQIELYDALIDGCREAVKGETLDPKVCPFVVNVLVYIVGNSAGIAAEKCYTIPLGSAFGFFWRTCKG